MFLNSCAENKFRCNYGACIEKSVKCNGIVNCVDGSDEHQCGRNPSLKSCPVTHFRCKFGRCIPANKICDSVMDCQDGSDESRLLCYHNLCPTDTFRCSFGGCVPLSVQCDGFVDCLDGSDEHRRLCDIEISANMTCPSIKKSSRMTRSCQLDFKRVSCEKPIKPGTVVTFSCSPFYLPASEKHNQNFFSYCQKNGVWSRDLLECVPECGKFEPVVPLIVQGWQPMTQFPWHVTLLKLQKNWQIACGASIISEYIILTAAHCVWDTNVESIRIGFGEWSDDQQKFNFSIGIRRKFVHPLYLDYEGHFTADIALLVLRKPVKFTRILAPICIDWELEDMSSHVKPTTIGYIMGLGRTEHNKTADKIQVIAVPVITNTQCISNVRDDFKKHVTPTIFCGGWRNGSSVCNGDSGGGVVFLMENRKRYVLQGIVSLSPMGGSGFEFVCDPMSYMVFTKVKLFINWIQFLVTQVNEKQEV